MREKPSDRKEKTPKQRTYCGKVVNKGAFYDNGGQCEGGMWLFNAVVYSNGQPIYGGKPHRQCRPCDCRLEFEARHDAKMASAGDR